MDILNCSNLHFYDFFHQVFLYKKYSQSFQNLDTAVTADRVSHHDFIVTLAQKYISPYHSVYLIRDGAPTRATVYLKLGGSAITENHHIYDRRLDRDVSAPGDI